MQGIEGVRLQPMYVAAGNDDVTVSVLCVLLNAFCPDIHSHI